MDPLVEAALRKWPGVPHCHGWLALDLRGHWWMRDDATQRRGAFPQAKGSRIEHDRLLAFIGRNYAADADGAWYFQNGPQRVYVDLEATPWVWRVDAQAPWSLTSHTGLPARPHSTWIDEAGRLYLATPLGLGIVHPQDMVHAAAAVEAGAWVPQPLAAAELPARFGFLRTPRQAG